ncbi:MAG: PHP domain-containing protein [Cyanobacteria bacterium P01_H01_bin.74]
MIDLHMHTLYSDGSVLPDVLVQLGLDHNLEAIAITDHDTTESLVSAKKAAAEKSSPERSIDIIPGIEINTYLEEQEVHVLGYYIDPDAEALKKVIKKHHQSRIDQIEGFVDTFKKKFKINFSFEDVMKHSNGIGTIGRPHVAKALIEKKVVSTMSEAFKKYLKVNCPTYVPRQTVLPHDAVEAIYDSGGIAVIAHPGEMKGFETLVTELIHYGLRGLEAYHKSHSPALVEYHCCLAEKLGLLVTGGTDFHGDAEAYPKVLEKLCLPEKTYAILKEEKERLALSKVAIKSF